MGLLDDFGSFIKTPEGQGLLSAAFGGLAGAQRGAPLNSLGRAGMAGVMGYGNAVDRQLQQSEASQMMKYRQAQMDNFQSEADARKLALTIAQRKQDMLPKLFQPASSGAPALNVDSTLPPEMRTGLPSVPAVPARPAGIDVQSAISAGFTPDEITKMDGLRNVGLDKVERTVKGIGQDGKEYETQMDAFGRPVGAPLAQWKAPILNDGGGQTNVLDPYNPTKVVGSIPKTMSFADKTAAGQLGIANQRLSMDKTINGLDANGGPSANVESTAQLIANGKLPPPTGFAASRPLSQAIMARVSEINPNFDAADWEAKKKASRDFATGKQGQTAQSLNVAVDHLHTLEGLVTALNNNDIPAANTIANFFSKQTGNPAVTNFDAVKKIVTDEVTKAVIGGAGGGVADRKAAVEPFMSANSPEQLNGAIKQYKQLMAGQLKGLELTYKRTTKNTDFRDSFLEPNTRSVMESLDATPNSTPKIRRFNLDGTEIKQ